MTIADIKQEIRTKYPDLDLVDKSKTDSLLLAFTSPTQQDYAYEIYLHDLNSDGVNATISATLLNDKDSDYFWYYPLDPYGSNSISEKENDCREFILETLEILTKYKTRITQKKGLLSQTFICEYLKNDAWTILYRHSALNFTGFKFPKINGRQNIYH